MNKQQEKFMKIIGGITSFCIIMLILFLSLPYYVLEPGYTALHMRLGAFKTAQNEAGAYFKLPVVDRIIFINNRIQKSVIETEALSKDLQNISIGVAINYRISDAIALYKSVGINYEQVIINPFAQESVKAICAKFTAEDLIQYRHEAKEKVFEELKTRLATLNIYLVDFNFIHSDFSRDFIHAVEQKQIAIQSSITAKNLTQRVNEEALQTRARAEAEAYSLKIKRESVTRDLIELKKIEASLKAIEKWNGKLPQVSSGNIPFINLDIK